MYDDYAAAVVTLARTLDASLDRLERNVDRSEHTIATVARSSSSYFRELRPPDTAGDPFDQLAAALAAAVSTSAGV